MLQKIIQRQFRPKHRLSNYLVWNLENVIEPIIAVCVSQIVPNLIVSLFFSLKKESHIFSSHIFLLYFFFVKETRNFKFAPSHNHN